MVLGALSRADAFVLVDEAGQGHGPYAFVQDTAILDGAYRLEPRGQSATLRGTADAGTWGPFFFTNQASFRIGAQRYEVMRTTPAFADAHAAGLQTRRVQQAMAEAATNEDPRASLQLVEAARAANPLGRNTNAVAAAVARLSKRAAEEEALRAAGKVKVEGRWMEAKAAEKRLRELEAARMQAQGFVQEDGEWMSLDAARERRLEKARVAARKAAEERRRFEQNKCRRCNGSGAIYFEIRPSPAAASTRGGSKPPDLRIEKPGVPPREAKYETERAACPDCNGTGQRP